MSGTAIFEQLESNVQCYARAFPCVFARAQGALLYDEHGRAYIDFLAGAGSLNYGHNDPDLKRALIDYLRDDGIAHSLDLHTTAKRNFLEALRRHVLAPRDLDYVVQFTGPTGTNAVEAALKLARRVTGRSSVVAFTNAFHGVSLGALAATANAHHRGAAGITPSGVARMPYDGYLGPDVDTLDYFERVLEDRSSGVDRPAAVIVETVQGEGGVNVATPAWLRRLADICARHGILLVVDDIQTGCGRTGTFFSFEDAGITPDVVTLAKSLSGFGLPLALTLFKPAHDCWQPGEHNGTFRGNNHAIVTATAALERYWRDGELSAAVARKSRVLRDALAPLVQRHAPRLTLRGRGLMLGLACDSGERAHALSRTCFEHGLLAETCGGGGQVLKLMPPLTVPDEVLARALDVLARAIGQVFDARGATQSAA